jgi:hypothetical protein
MRPFGAVLRQRGVGWACAVAVGALVVAPVTASARPQAATAAAGGTVYGGVTSQGFPVVIETTRSGRKITGTTVAIRLTCASGGTVTVPDGYRNLAVSKKRKFGASFGPITRRNDDGTATDFEGNISGSFNKARTKASGKWSFKGTDRDAAGAVTDTCEASNISWRAKQ